MRLRVPLFLVVLMLVLILLPGRTYAVSQYVGYTASNVSGSPPCGSAGCSVCQADGGDGSKCGTGSAIKSPLTGSVISVSLFVGDIAPNQVEVATFPAGSTPTTTSSGPPCNFPGQTCITVNGGQTFTVQDVETLAGVSTFTFTTINLATPVSVTLNQYIMVQFTKTSGGVAAPHGLVTICGLNCQAVINTSVWDGCIDFGTISPLVGTGYTTASAGNCQSVAYATGASFQTGGTISSLTQCYGNCGSPAVTIANTNSTHTTNFNQSITLFYMAQSNLNGFVANVTARVAKTYSNGQSIGIGLYKVDLSCTASANPFTAQCPGFLVQQQAAFNPQKGTFFMASTAQILNGQWFGLALTGAFQGLDINDTNTNVALFQTGGQMPTVITQESSLGNSKMALYAFITGNTIITGPGPQGFPPGCQTVTCGILALWQALGGDVAAGLGGFLIVLGLITGFFLYISRQHNADGSLKGFALPVEFLGIIAVVVLIMFSVAGVIPAWIPGVIIFLVAGYFVAGVWGRRQHSNTVEG